MKDRMRESLSALCDGECNELELRRVINHVGDDAGMREEWRRYHLIGALMRDEPAGAVDLSKGIMDAIDNEVLADYVPEESVDDSVASTITEERQRGLPQWLVSGAVAASVTMAVLVGARMISDNAFTGAQPMMAASAVVSEAPMAEAQMAEAAPVAVLLAAGQPASSMSEEELRQAQEVLRQYVLEHEEQAAGMSGADPFARVANFGQTSSAAKAR